MTRALLATAWLTLAAMAVAPAIARAQTVEPGGPPAIAPALPKVTPAAYTDVPPAPVATLPEALARAYWTHPAILSQRSRLKATNQRLVQARSVYAPAIDLEAGYGYQRDNIEPVSGKWLERQGWTSSAAAVLTQPVFTFGRNAGREREALAQIEFQRATLRVEEADTLLRAIRAYVGTRRDRNAVAIVADDYALISREFEANTGRFAQREVTATDVAQVQTRLAQSEVQLTSARSFLASGEGFFLYAVGALPAADLAEPDPLPLPVRTLDDAYAYADAHNPLLAAANARERISRAALAQAKAALLPRVDLRGRADYGSVSPYTDDRRQTTLRGDAVVSVPLYDGGNNWSQVAEARAANDADWRLVDATLRENRAEVAAAWADWQAQTAAIDTLRGASEAARVAFDGAVLQERAGLRSSLDVLVLARELVSARTAQNGAVANAYLAHARLLAAIGALTLERLAPGAPRFDIADDFAKVDGAGPIPILSPALRALDRITLGSENDRPNRDGAALLASPPVNLPGTGPIK